MTMTSLIYFLVIGYLVALLLTFVFLVTTSDHWSLRDSLLILVSAIAWPVFWVCAVIVGAISFIAVTLREGEQWRNRRG